MDSQMISLVHSDGAGDLHFSRDGTLLATCGQDARLCVHETARALRGEERVVASFACAEPVTALALFSNGQGAKGDANSTVSCLAVSEDRLVTVYSVRDADGYISVAPVETLARLSVPAMSVTVAEQTGACAFAGEDASIHTIAAPGAEMESVKGCRPDVVGLAYDPLGDYVCAASTAGHIRLFKCSSKVEAASWDLTDTAKAATMSASGAAVPRWRPAWSPDGRFLALVGAESIKIIKRGTWSLAAILSGTHKAPVMLTAFSPNGYYLASADTAGVVAVWELNHRKCLRTFTFDAGAQAVQFCPSGNLLAVLTLDGEYALMADVIPSDLPAASDLPLKAVGEAFKEGPNPNKVEKKEHLAVEEASAGPAEASEAPSPGGAADGKAKLGKSVAKTKQKKQSPAKKAQTTKAATKKGGRLLDGDSDSDSDDDDDVFAAAKAKKKTAAPAAVAPPTGAASAKPSSDLDDDDETMVDGDISALKAKFTGPVAASDIVQDASKDASSSDGNNVSKTIIQTAPETAVQDVFQPGATYPRSEVARRFLCWNLEGSITSREEQGYHALEIEFSDSSARRPIRFADKYDFGIAALGARGAFFASQCEKSAKPDMEGNHSVLMYKAFDTWAHNSEWSVTLANGESAVACTIGTNWAAAATTAGLVRIFRDSGLQMAPFAAPGPVVAMAAHGGSLAVAYVRGAPLTPTQGATQHLGFVLYDVEVNCADPFCAAGLMVREVSQGALPLAGVGEALMLQEGTSAAGGDNLLEWLGFSTGSDGTEGVLYAFDTAGRLFSLSPADQKTWMLSLDVRNAGEKVALRSPEEAHWVVGVAHGNCMVVTCKGRQRVDRQPKTSPKPTLTALKLGSGVLAGAGEGASVVMRRQGELVQSLTSFAQKRRRAAEVAAANGDDLVSSTFAEAEALLDRSMLKLMQGACEADDTALAYDLAQRLHVEKVS